MINKNELKKIARRIFDSKNEVQDPKLIHPRRDWGIGLSVGVLIFVVTAIWSADTYLSNKKIAEGNGTFKEAEVVVYRESLVEAALESYRVKYDAHQDLLNSMALVSEINEVEVETSSSSEDVVDQNDDLESENEESDGVGGESSEVGEGSDGVSAEEE